MEAIIRGWENFISRLSGPFNFRFFIQPAIGIIMALRAGLHDAKEGRPAYLWSMFTNPNDRQNLWHEGWKDIRTTFFLSAILDSVYQLITHQSIYFLELLFTTTILALIPYLIFRGPFNLIARLFIRNKHTRTRFSKKSFTKSNSTTNNQRR